jgi:hypothetical protein
MIVSLARPGLNHTIIRTAHARRFRGNAACLVENAGFGASAAAPIARKVLDAYLLGNGATPPDTHKAVAPRPPNANGP